MENTDPLAILGSRVTEPELSEALGSVHVTVAPLEPGSVSTVMFAGQLDIAGFCSSVKDKNTGLSFKAFICFLNGFVNNVYM